MFNEMMIARVEYRLRDARLNSRTDVEGVTVSVPSVIDRGFLALRAALTGRQTTQTACSNRPISSCTVAK